MEYFLELFFSGLTRGSIYALIALGYTMVYGIIELINFAHGEIYMIGAFVGLVVAGILTSFGFPAASIVILATIAAVIYASAYGYTLEKIAYRPLRGCTETFSAHLGYRYVNFPSKLCNAFPDFRLSLFSKSDSRVRFS